MPEIKNVSGTAFIIAEFRAEENDASEPLYRDEIVKLFLDRETQQVAQSFPPVKDMVKLRTRYFDEVLAQQIAIGYQQVVILGYGSHPSEKVSQLLKVSSNKRSSHTT
jgi:O-methyltransferase involved in polyketide biosynthesis